MKKYILTFVCLILLLHWPEVNSQTQNKTDRLEWFQDLGFGMFIHWSLDSQLGSVISHSLVGASEDYVRRYINDLPGTFYPEQFNPDKWARLAKVCGFRYVVFTTKHHSGFCMFHTKTNRFNIMETPYQSDIVSQLVKSLRKQGIAPGFYFSPDDFYFLHQQGTLISRKRPEADPNNNPELMENNKKQLTELLTNYGPIDVLFFDGPSGDVLAQKAWSLQPKVVVTRGVLETPEQKLPNKDIHGPWEACFTMGTQWQYKPTNETYKSGTKVIEMLIEIRARGGNLLLNVGPTPEGEIPRQQRDILREVGLWLFVNGQAIYGVRPWYVAREDNIWFTRKKNKNTVYAFVTEEEWPWGKQKSFTLESVKASPATRVSILGQNDKVLEYRPENVPKTTWRQDKVGLHITATRAQRLYNDRTWPNPVVLKITHVKTE